jgi:hypothetical protein
MLFGFVSRNESSVLLSATLVQGRAESLCGYIAESMPKAGARSTERDEAPE